MEIKWFLWLNTVGVREQNMAKEENISITKQRIITPQGTDHHGFHQIYLGFWWNTAKLYLVQISLHNTFLFYL